MLGFFVVLGAEIPTRSAGRCKKMEEFQEPDGKKADFGNVLSRCFSFKCRGCSVTPVVFRELPCRQQIAVKTVTQPNVFNCGERKTWSE